MSDFISRDAAIEITMQYCPDDDGSCSKALADLREMLDEIESIPAADVRSVVRGFNEDKDWPSLFKCSVCGWSDRDATTGDTRTYNYCPNCGAKMEES